jgi:transposase
MGTSENRGGLHMLNFHLKLTSAQKKKLVKKLKDARARGDIREATRVMAILALGEGQGEQAVAATLRVTVESIHGWVKKFLLYSLRGLTSKKSPGRPSNLTNAQKRELGKLIDDGPEKAGFIGNCWRSPMVQELIHERFSVLYSVHYIAELLKNMGFSYQKAKFVSDHLNEEKRAQWLEETWPKIIALAKEKNAYLLFGDEASFPQWGTLSYTWAKRGQQPTIETSGKRKGYKVFGLIDYFTGRFFYKCQEERLNSATYMAYLGEILAKTRKHLVIVQDGARYHTSAAMQKFLAKHQDRLTVFDLPSYSPDYNPIEKLWKKVKQKGTHLHYFPTFESLKKKVHESLGFFENAPNEVLSLFGFFKDMNVTA